ncbi:baseplate J/gp47 family protein [Klebsiella quasipneumoniae]|uniref:baseplate J/gp47 family protein n=1 Tax=Klebsiella quasipneumoniae TaxID=1463165 RepID=UPI003529FE00
MSTTITTSVPSVTFSTTGLDVPDEADILAGRLTDLSTALGTSMSKELTTPQGQIAVADTAIIADKNDQCLAIMNMVNPDYSTGRWQDAIGRIYFIDRKGASGTIVTATCSGLVGTLIPAGSIAQDANGYLYFSLSDATIGSDGSASVEFQNQTTGPIACPIGELNTIYKAVSGWSTITNVAAGVLGSDEEGRAAFEYRRRQSVAKNASNTLAAIYAAILEVDGVTDAYVTDNKTSTAVEKGVTNYSIAPHSFYAAVYGGSDADIAKAIWSAAPPGVDMNGDTSYTVQDTENYVYPYPSYDIRWETPTPTSMYVEVQIVQSNLLPSDVTSQIKAAIQKAFNGEDGGTRARIGSKVFAGRYYSGIQAIDPNNMEILGITLSLDGLSYGPSVEFGIDEIPTLDDANILVIISS